MFGIGEKVGDAARRAGVVVASMIFAAVGVGFLTVTAWLVLTELRDATFAAGIIGMVYCGVAALLLAIGLSGKSRKRSEPHPAATVEAQSPAQLVILSFLQGVEQGRKAKQAA